MLAPWRGEQMGSEQVDRLSAGQRMGMEQSKRSRLGVSGVAGLHWAAVPSAPGHAAPSHYSFLALEAPEGAQRAEPLHWPFGLAAPLHPAPTRSGAGWRGPPSLTSHSAPPTSQEAKQAAELGGFLGRGLGVPAAPTNLPMAHFSGKSTGLGVRLPGFKSWLLY